MNKVFTIDTKSISVAADVVATQYEISFSGPSRVDTVVMPYDALVPTTVDFADGDWTATAGLYDANHALVGDAGTVDFKVKTAGPGPDPDPIPTPIPTDVRSVNGLTVTDV